MPATTKSTADAASGSGKDEVPKDAASSGPNDALADGSTMHIEVPAAEPSKTKPSCASFADVQLAEDSSSMLEGNQQECCFAVEKIWECCFKNIKAG